MNKQDNFFQQFKEAADKTEQHRFPGFDEVWEQVETRLDQKEQPKVVSFPYKKWLAMAATLLVMLFAGVVIYQSNKNITPGDTVITNPSTKPELQAEPNNPTQSVVTDESLTGTTTEQPSAKPAIVSAERKTEAKPAPDAMVSLEPKVTEIFIEGIVTDTTGNPLAYATIVNEGNKNGVTADANGAFNLKAKKGDLFAFNALGYDAKRIQITERNNLKIALEPSSSSLSEVVVVGYGAHNKVAMTGSVAGINQQPLMASNNSMNVERQLQGRAAGLHIENGSKRKKETLPKGYVAPESSPEIQIRGMASVKPGNDPMYVINGMISNGKALKQIDPQQIEKINMLKDASATAIYGSRAQNGVIIITTKTLTKKQQKDLQQFNDQLLKSGIKIDPAQVNDNDKEEYNPLVENPFTSPQVSPLSTFSIDVDNASYTNIRRYINNGEKVPQDAVRIEEMINFFKYQYTAPTDNKPFAAQTEYSDAPWNKAHKLLRIALKAKDIPTEALPPSNIVFLLDVSGSMNEPNKLPLLKSSMKVLVDQLRKEDKVSIVVYAGAAGLVLPPTNGDDKATIMDALTKLNAGGSTAGGAGIELAYKTAAENFIKGGNNRVVLATDGDFNVGIYSQGDLQHLIEEKRKTGIFLTCLGFGMGNYKDNRLETLADKGNGNYAYIDNMQESNRFLGKEFKGTVFTVAKDVKLQIEFNPAQVKSYRLIGYENRKLNDEDFVNDKIDAGEMGIAHTVTALYEIIPVGVNSSFAPEIPTLKYSDVKVAIGNGRELATIKFRYKKPDEDKSTESTQMVLATATPLKSASEDFRFAAAVAWFGLKLRASELIADNDMQNIIRLAKSASNFDPDGYRAECIRLMESTK
jgi:Ca-activated chloride channel family protein